MHKINGFFSRNREWFLEYQRREKQYNDKVKTKQALFLSSHNQKTAINLIQDCEMTKQC